MNQYELSKWERCTYFFKTRKNKFRKQKTKLLHKLEAKNPKKKCIRFKLKKKGEKRSVLWARVAISPIVCFSVLGWGTERISVTPEDCSHKALHYSWLSSILIPFNFFFPFFANSRSEWSDQKNLGFTKPWFSRIHIGLKKCLSTTDYLCFTS